MTHHTRFENFRTSLDGRSPQTIKAYLVALRGFATWFEEQPGEETFAADQISAAAIESYLAYLVDVGRSPHTQRQVINALRRYCSWAVQHGLLTTNPARQIPVPTIVQVAPRELSPEQRYALKVQVERTQSRRLSAIFALAYWSGLRIGEIATIRLADVNVNRRSGTLRIVNSKGGKSRELDLHNASRRALSIYLTEGARDVDSSYLFTSQRAAWLRQQGRPDHLTARGIDHLWTKMKTNAPFARHALIADITMHDLRHDFAHRARHSGWTLEEIAVYLGHQTKSGTPAITTTARYTLPSRKQLKRRLKTLAG